MNPRLLTCLLPGMPLLGTPVLGQSDIDKQIEFEKTIIEDEGCHFERGWRAPFGS